jgi:tetratricopeptide (TPR) repeat protein/tRNA A-37 threonylcarbamoyl transferase component Bud32
VWQGMTVGAALIVAGPDDSSREPHTDACASAGGEAARLLPVGQCVRRCRCGQRCSVFDTPLVDATAEYCSPNAGDPAIIAPGMERDLPPSATLSYDNSPLRDAPLAMDYGAVLPRGATVQRYVILDRVGEGGMGVVYAAYDPVLDRRVALKFLAHRGADRDGVRERRLLREAQAMARLSHPNVVVVYEVGTFQGHVFLAMEFIQGVDLRTWLSQRSRTFSEIMDVFRAAARGLSAAHAAGIIHRDFKPENVLVDEQGRPRVTDFGLSRATPDPEDKVSGAIESDAEDGLSSPSMLSRQLTRTNGLVGTPSYMSPEQHRGGTVDARSDQFSFCVALYEAVHGELPFRGSADERRAKALAGEIAHPPAKSSVPRWCRQVLMRGLAPTPDDRCISMEALLHELSPRPSRRRRVVLLAATALVTAAGGAYAFVEQPAAPPGARCDLGARQLAGIWDQARKQQLREAFQRSGARGAEVTWRSFSSILDARAAAWAAMQNQACAATHIEGTQSPAVLDLRIECLDRKRQEMKALVDVYAAKPDAKSLDSAVGAADKLSSVAGCADVANLRAVVPLPEEPAMRARIQSIRDRLAYSNALLQAGRYTQGRDYMTSLMKQADATGYAVLRAEAGHALGSHLSKSVAAGDEAAKVLFDAAELAVNGRDWRLEAEILVTMVANYARTRRISEGRLAARFAAMAVERANADHRLRARLAGNRGFVEETAGRTADALADYRTAETLFERSGERDSLTIAVVLTQMASALQNLGRNREAVQYLERSLAIDRATLRPDHPQIARALVCLGQAHMQLGHFLESRSLLLRARDIVVHEEGPESYGAALPLQQLAIIESMLGNADRALALHAQVLSALETAARSATVDVSWEYAFEYTFMGDAERRAGLDGRAERNFKKAVQVNSRGPVSDLPSAGEASWELGFIYNGRRDYEHALHECQRALDIFSHAFGPTSGNLIFPLECLGEALIGLRRVDAARRHLERALTVADQSELGPQWTAGARFQLVRARWATPSDRTLAMELAHSTLEELKRAEGDNHKLIGRIETWLEVPGRSPRRHDAGD